MLSKVHAALPALIFNLIPIIRHAATVQIVSSAHNKTHILTIFLTFQPFLKRYLFQMDELALPGNLQSRNTVVPLPQM
jgi:hypothetical protein